MKIVGLLSYFDESPTWLAATVSSLAQCCDHVVAVDGGYWLFPGARENPRSGAECSDAIYETAYGAGIGVTLHTPAAPYMGNEVEKRSLMFRLAEPLVDLGRDWYLIVDADEVITHVAADLREQLARTELNVAEYSLYWRDDRHATQLRSELERRHATQPGQTPVRGLMRALPGLRVERAHYVYVYDRADGLDGYLWGSRDFHELEEALDLTSFVQIEHRHAFRDRHRQLRAATYYERRDTYSVEALADLYMEGADGKPTLVRAQIPEDMN